MDQEMPLLRVMGLKMRILQTILFLPLLVLIYVFIYVWMTLYEIYYGKKLITKPGMACECQ